MREVIYDAYIINLKMLLNKKIRLIKSATSEDEKLNISNEIGYEATGMFRLYRSILSDFGLDYYNNDEPFRQPTLEEQEQYGDDLTRILEYRNFKLPEFFCENSSDAYITLELPSGQSHTICTRFDWDYEFDLLYDIGYIFNSDDIDLDSLQAKLNTFKV